MHRATLLVTTLSWILAGPLFARNDPPAPPPALPVDPVELVRGVEKPGDPGLVVDRAGYRYTFATPDNKKAFESDPAKYEIQFGGACARMGPLGGACSTDHYAAHDGKIYVFASKQCRATFVKDPTRLLEGPDPIPASTPEALARGAALLERVAQSMGGVTINSLRTFSFVASRVEKAGDKDYTVVNTFAGATGPARFFISESWNDSWWGHSLGPAEASSRSGKLSDAPDTDSATPLVASQRESLERQVYRWPLALLLARNEPGFVALALPPASDDATPLERVSVSFRGATTVLAIDAAAGRILSSEYPARGPDLFMTTATDTFDDFRPVGGLVLPHKVSTRYASSKPDAPAIVREYHVNVNDGRFTPQRLTRPAPNPS